MKISEKWLRTLINPQVDLAELSSKLTMAGLEVESVTKVAALFSGVLIGEVIEVIKHPDADRLRVCKVNIGSEPLLGIVCGAPNVRVGLKIPVAVLGATLADGTKIKKAKLRGVESEGMLCSETELGLPETAKGLLELPEDAPIGTELAKYLALDDNILDLNITPNRGDCLSMLGVAREIAAIFSTQLDMRFQNRRPQGAPLRIKIVNNVHESCPRYVGRAIYNININAKTPSWLIGRLLACGMRPINPVVDVLNYVMLELGQPLHAFDLSAINGNIEVRMAKVNEKLQLLDNTNLTLTASDLLIADQEKPLALAGIMGGASSQVGKQTQNLFLESAFFMPAVIAGSAQRHVLHTEASARYERGVDPLLQAQALERCTQLLLDIVGGEPTATSEFVAEQLLPVRAPIQFSCTACRRALGIEISDEEIIALLKRVNMELTNNGEVIPPSYRFDVAMSADLIEEIARLHGYDKIKGKMPLLPLACANPENLFSFGIPDTALIKRRQIADYLVANGYQEIITLSFIHPKFQQPAALTLQNPISADASVMRQSIWPGLLNTICYNQNRREEWMRFFEMGLCFVNNAQPFCLAGAITGGKYPEQWGVAKSDVDFFDIKNDVTNIVKLFHKDAQLEFKVEINPFLHPTITARIYYNNEAIGYVGKLHPSWQETLKIATGVYLFEIDLAFLSEKIDLKFKNISKFPFIERDIAMVLSKNIAWLDIKKQIENVVGELLQDVSLFDVYEGEGVPLGHRSLALHLIFQNATRTLVEEEVEVLVQKVITSLTQGFNAKLRG